MKIRMIGSPPVGSEERQKGDILRAIRTPSCQAPRVWWCLLDPLLVVVVVTVIAGVVVLVTLVVMAVLAVGVAVVVGVALVVVGLRP